MNKNNKGEMTKISIFEQKEIRKVWYNDEWWFSIVDVVGALTNSMNVADYIKKMRKRDECLSEGWGQIVTPLAMDTIGGRQSINCANTEGLFRIIQSIPSPKAEPFKMWLAKVGYERIKEIEDPELATKRTRDLYKAKGYSDSWIEKRMRGIAIREELTDEWKNRGAENRRDYEILTAEISKATFGVTPSEYKELKGLEKENLRDHMDDFELIFSMLGERSTTEIHRNENSMGIKKLKKDAKAGGDIAGGARESLEKKLGHSIVSDKNFIKHREKDKILDK